MLFNENVNSGNQNLSIELPLDIKPGIYFVRVTNNSMNSIHKILVN